MQLFQVFQYIFLGIACTSLIGFGIAWYVLLGNRNKKQAPQSKRPPSDPSPPNHQYNGIVSDPTILRRRVDHVGCGTPHFSNARNHNSTPMVLPHHHFRGFIPK